MVKVYYSGKLENIYWKIYAENINKSVYYFPSETTSENALIKLTQTSLFEQTQDKKVNVIDISEWKLSNKQTQTDIEQLHKIDEEIIFVLEATSIKNKLFDELKIAQVKIPNITKRSKNELVSYLLAKAKIQLDYQTNEMLLDLLPDNVKFIANEIEKLKLIGKTSYTEQEIKNIVFDTGDATIFKLIDAWLVNDQEKAIHELNNLLSGNFDILEVIPMFAYKLIQIKLYLLAKKSKWSSEQISTKLGIPFWLQNTYASFKPIDQKLLKINDMISKLYNFDITIKKTNINKKDSIAVPYSQLIKILFE